VILKVQKLVDIMKKVRVQLDPSIGRLIVDEFDRTGPQFIETEVAHQHLVSWIEVPSHNQMQIVLKDRVDQMRSNGWLIYLYPFRFSFYSPW
jgi:hypothetical protein